MASKRIEKRTLASIEEAIHLLGNAFQIIFGNSGSPVIAINTPDDSLRSNQSIALHGFGIPTKFLKAAKLDTDQTIVIHSSGHVIWPFRRNHIDIPFHSTGDSDRDQVLRDMEAQYRKDDARRDEYKSHIVPSLLILGVPIEAISCYAQPRSMKDINVKELDFFQAELHNNLPDDITYDQVSVWTFIDLRKIELSQLIDGIHQGIRKLLDDSLDKLSKPLVDKFLEELKQRGITDPDRIAYAAHFLFQELCRAGGIEIPEPEKQSPGTKLLGSGKGEKVIDVDARRTGK